MSLGIHLALKEVWRYRSRFVSFGLVVALITLLVLFIAGLGEGLGAGNREYIEGLDGELVVFEDTARLSIAGSRIERATLRAIAKLDGVEAAGPIGLSVAVIPLGPPESELDISLIGVEPGRPGEPKVVTGRGLERRTADSILVDRTIAAIADVQVGEELSIRTLQGGEEEFYSLAVVGVTESQKYGLRPSAFVPYVTWDRVRTRPGGPGTKGDLSCNVVAVRVQPHEDAETVIAWLQAQVPGVQAVDRVAAYESTPGYAPQQTTLATQNFFALFIGTLVIGGFFQIQTLQKVPQIGMLKAIGTPSSVVAAAAVTQILAVTVLGVVVGSLGAAALALVFPPEVPVVFEARSAVVAIGSMMVTGPIGGLVSVRYSLRIEPLRALGLG